jgi:tricorn protease-like protein
LICFTVKSRFKKVHFSLILNRELFDLSKIYVVNLKTGCPKKISYVGEFAT